jgi:energy-coupling factor transporter ATP-binding protein EcfA2
MKISKLHIDQFRHLENLDFDFTYPEDFHIAEKRGKPLDKICFIGQSASGKTGLLELINSTLFKLKELETRDDKYLDKKVEFEADFIFDNIEINKNTIKFNNKNYSYSPPASYTGKGIDFQVKQFEIKNILNSNVLNYFITSGIISEKNISFFAKNPIIQIEKYTEELKTIELDYFFENNGMIFDENTDSRNWLLVVSEILQYRKKYNQITSELINKGLLADTKKLQEEYNKWQKENPNKIEEFAKKFNPIIEKFNLEVDLVNTEYTIPLKNKKTKEIIPIHNTSTGTKGLLLTFLPLFKLDTKDAIILIDEPERSLYPDMQMDLMEYYQNLAPQAQFIVATHSPFIAASFEADERFILYFDEEGKVAVRRGTSPIGDDPNDMLKNDFGLEFLMNKKGVEAFERYRELKKRIASENNEVEKDKLLEEILSLANAYKF